MDSSDRAPAVARLAWGRIEIEGLGVFKDAKLFPGGVREWDWSETGTGHSPGIQPADVEELLERGATEIVLGTGMYGRLRVSPETVRLLEAGGVPFHKARTKEAVDIYNDLRLQKPVGALFHTTC